MATPDPLKKAAAAEKRRLRKRAASKKEEESLERRFLDETPSRVTIVAGKTLIIEPAPLPESVVRYFSGGEHSTAVGWFVALAAVSYLGAWAAIYLAVAQLGLSLSDNLIAGAALLVTLLTAGRIYVMDVVKGISQLNEAFHLEVSGKNFMVHGGNAEEYIAAAPKVDSEGKWNIMADIVEPKGSLEFVWVYGPDINNKTTGSREFTERGDGTQQHLNLGDIDLIRTFLRQNGIEIRIDRRIDE